MAYVNTSTAPPTGYGRSSGTGWDGFFDSQNLFSPGGLGTQFALGYVNSVLTAGARRRAAAQRRRAMEMQRAAQAATRAAIDTKNAMNQQAYDRTVESLNNRAQGMVVTALRNWEQNRDASVGRGTGDTGVQDTASEVSKSVIGTGAADWLDANKAQAEQARVQGYTIPDPNMNYAGAVLGLGEADRLDRQAADQAVGFGRFMSAVGQYKPRTRSYTSYGGAIPAPTAQQFVMPQSLQTPFRFENSVNWNAPFDPQNLQYNGYYSGNQPTVVGTGDPESDWWMQRYGG